LKSGKRNALLLLPAAVLVLVVGCGLLSPLLLQWIGGHVAGQFGITWQGSSAEGFASIKLEQVEVDRDGFRVRIDTLKLPQPGPWLLSRAGLRQPPELSAGTVNIHLKAGAQQTTGAPVGPEILETIRAGLLEAQPWLPDVAIDRLEIVKTGPDPLLTAHSIRFNGRALSGVTEPVQRLPSLQLGLWLGDSDIRSAATGQMDGESFRLVLISETGPSGGAVRGRLVSGNVPLQIAVTLDAEDWIPAVVSLEADGWPVPLFLVPEASPIHASPKMDLDFRFSGDSFAGDLRLASPETGPRREAASADIRFSGNAEFIEVARLSIESDWLEANLSQPVRYNLGNKNFAGEARFRARVELDKQSWIPATGTVEADVEFEPETTGLPQLTFNLSGNDLVIAGQTLQSLALNGLLDYPRLSVEEFVAELPGESRIGGGAGVRLDSREIEGNLDYQISPEWLASLAPQLGLTSVLAGSAEFEGVPSNIGHSGRIEPVGLEIDGLQPLRLSLEWSGHGTRAIDVLADLESEPGGALHLVAEIEAPGQSSARTVRIAEAELLQAGKPALAMDEPVSIRLDTTFAIPVIEVSEFKLHGNTGSLSGSLDQPKEALSMEVNQLDTGFLSDWLARPVPRVVIDSGNLVVDKLDPSLAGSFAFQAHTASEQLELLSLAVTGAFTDSGIEIESLEGRVEDTPFVRGSVGLPIRVFPLGLESGQRWQISPDGLLKGSLSSEISRELLEDFPDIPYLDRLAGTHLNLELGGTLGQPSGTVDAYLAVLPGVLFDARLQGYQIEELTISARLEPDTIRIDSLRGKLREAIIEATGTLETRPLVAFVKGSEPDWRKALRNADLDVSLKGFRADSFTSLLPGYLRPTGRAAADIAVEPGPRLDGEIRLEGFSLRPTLYTQTIDDINVTLDLDDSRLSLNTASASVGGSAVTATGYVDVRSFQEPLYRLEISGLRTPLVRTPDLLLHADVDLLVDRPKAGSEGSLTGTLRLRDSVLLMDIDPLAARTAGRSMAKPPFFRVPVEPFSGWELDIRITGEDALRFRSQYAKALLSVNMSLDGTLGTPVLVGDIFSTDGLIQFPGTSMQLSRSEIFVTREQQQSLQLDLNATGRAASTIISMRVGGSADEPHVEFSSTPALSNAQIFQLLATGSLERGGVGNIGLYLGKGLLGPGSADGSLMDRLTVEVGRDVSETGENTLDLYLDLTERLRLHGEYDKYDDQNLNLEWEVFSK
jgi:translocation and assembly module TamB